MAMAVARVGAQFLSVKCRICGRPSLKGAKLCDECVAAVKRARHVNTLTSEFLPQPGRRISAPLPLRAPSPSQRPATHRRSTRRSWMPTRPADWRVLIAFTVFGVALIGTAYLAFQEIAEPGTQAQIAPAVDTSATRDHASWMPTDAPAEGASVERGPLKAAESAAMPPVEIPPAVVQSPQAAPLPETRSRKAAMENRRKLAMRTNPPHSSEVSDEARTAIAASEAAVASSPAPAAVAEPAVPDRWETMNAALAACSREGFLAGVMCTERVRYQYCEGYWGRVPQCRAAARSDTSR